MFRRSRGKSRIGQRALSVAMTFACRSLRLRGLRWSWGRRLKSAEVSEAICHNLVDQQGDTDSADWRLYFWVHVPDFFA